MLVVGEEGRAIRVRRTLEGNRPGATGVVTAVSMSEAARWLAADPFEAVVLVAPVRGTTAAHALSALRAATPRERRGAFVVLVPEGFSQERVSGLYERGARAVLAWPDDLGLLGRLIETTLESTSTEPPERVDDALEQVVKERLRVRLRRFARGLGVETRRGVTRLTGRVSSLWAARAVARQAAACPGVASVDAEGLKVEAPERDDAAIGREIRAVLDGSITVDASTLGVTVHDGRVVLLGCVLEGEREHVLELVSMVPGVRSVADRSSASPRDKKRSRSRARRLQARLRSLGVGRGLRVAVVGPMAVLRGVGSPGEIRAAQESLDRWTRANDAIRKVLPRAGPRLQPSPDAGRR